MFSNAILDYHTKSVITWHESKRKNEEGLTKKLVAIFQTNSIQAFNNQVKWRASMWRMFFFSVSAFCLTGILAPYSLQKCQCRVENLAGFFTLKKKKNKKRKKKLSMKQILYFLDKVMISPIFCQTLGVTIWIFIEDGLSDTTSTALEKSTKFPRIDNKQQNAKGRTIGLWLDNIQLALDFFFCLDQDWWSFIHTYIVKKCG